MHCQKGTITIKTWGQHDKFCDNNMITVKATKNTYDSKEDLKDNGFGWNKEERCWERTFENMEEYNRFMDKWMNETYYGRKTVNKCHALVEFEVIEEDVEEEETAETSEEKLMEEFEGWMKEVLGFTAEGWEEAKERHDLKNAKKETLTNDITDNMEANEIIVAFKIGRGGRFGNSGYKTYNPRVNKLSDCYGDSTIVNEDEEGNPLPDEDWTLIDSGGNVILRGEEAITADTGVLDWDGEYDTDIVKYLDECTDEEIDILYRYYLDDEYMGEDIINYVCSRMDVHRLERWEFSGGNQIALYCHDCIAAISYDGWDVLADDIDPITADDVKEWLEDEDIDALSISKFAEDIADSLNDRLRLHEDDDAEEQGVETVEARMSAIGGGCKCKVINAVELDDAVMYTIKVDDCLTTCAIVYEDGTLFHLWDWQGAHPETAEEIADYDWRTEDGRRAVMLDGMPRVL